LSVSGTETSAVGRVCTWKCYVRSHHFKTSVPCQGSCKFAHKYPLENLGARLDAGQVAADRQGGKAKCQVHESGVAISEGDPQCRGMAAVWARRRRSCGETVDLGDRAN
jgi:hypothetical protein